LRALLLAHVETSRPYTLFYAGLVSLGGALLAAGHADPWRLAGAWLVPTLGWLAGLYGGDYFDRHLDAVAKPQRPIPSGRLRAEVALGVMIGCIGAGLVLAVVLNPRTLALVALATGVGLAYNNLLKARGGLGNAARGALTAGAFVFGTMATSQLPTLRLLPLALVFWLHDAASNLVGTLRDVEGDRAGGCATLPVRRGIPATVRTIVLLDAGWMLLAAAGPEVAGVALDAAAYAAFLGAAVATGLAALGVLLTGTRPAPARMLLVHEVLVVERLVLAAALIAGAGAPGLALALLLPSAAVTLGSQVWLRRRHDLERAVDGSGAGGFSART
jgi:4-hydroxybenzoate polyprenyltransferase/geranylgeranylglycerol-phosphate geranylgeranyltransferase